MNIVIISMLSYVINEFIRSGVLSGTLSGKIFLHSTQTGALQRVFNDHFEAIISSLDYDPRSICKYIQTFLEKEGRVC